MKLTILGSGDKAGIPRIGCHCKVCQEARTFENSPLSRTRPSALIETENISLLIDVTPDFRFQALKLRRAIDALYITHVHWDHIGGMVDLHYIENIPRVITSSSEVTRFAKTLETSKTGSVPKIELLDPYKNTSLGDIEITSVKLAHSVETYGLFIEKGNEKIAYLLDSTSKIYPETVETCLDVDLVVCDATNFNTEITNHMTVLEALKFAEKIHAGKVILSHISHHSLGHHALREALNIYSHVIPAFDNLTLEI